MLRNRVVRKVARRTLAALAVLAVAVTAAPASAAELPRPTSRAQATGTWGGGATGLATFTGARIGRHPTYDRVVLDLTPPGSREGQLFGPATPSYGAWSVNPNTLRVNVRPVRTDAPYAFSYQAQLPAVRQVHVGEDSGAGLEVDITVTTRTGFRVFALGDPNRIVVDVAHPR